MIEHNEEIVLFGYDWYTVLRLNHNEARSAVSSVDELSDQLIQASNPLSPETIQLITTIQSKIKDATLAAIALPADFANYHFPTDYASGEKRRDVMRRKWKSKEVIVLTEFVEPIILRYDNFNQYLKEFCHLLEELLHSKHLPVKDRSAIFRVKEIIESTLEEIESCRQYMKGFLIKGKQATLVWENRVFPNEVH